MTMKLPLALLFVNLFASLSACQSRSSGPLVLERINYKLAGSGCDTTTNRGVDVSVSYFLLKEADSEASQRINDSLRTISAGSVTGWLDSATVAAHPDARQDLDKAAAQFAQDYRSVQQEMGQLSNCWQLETRADTLHASPRLLTVKVETFAYTGGAHPLSNFSFYTFDRETGQSLNLPDLVADTTALLGVVEKAFRQQQKVGPNANLEEEGYFLRDGHFFLPTNVGVGQKGLIFYYNPYEIAAYAVGPVEVLIPYEKLNGILREDRL